jgi:hypothetical protein
MELEDMVCDLSYAKRLNELGVKQESNFKFVKFDGHEYLLMTKDEIFLAEVSSNKKISTFSTDELIEMLPNRFIHRGINYYLSIDKTSAGYILKSGKFKEVFYFQNEKRANSLAKCLIWCIENEYVEVK